MKRVFSSYDFVLLHHARNLLEAEGVKTEVRNQYLASAMGELPPAECQPELWVVNEGDVVKAEEILRRPAPAGPDWLCVCGEKLAAQFTQCWHCGADRRM